MILEEYCSYILSRERDTDSFSIPGSNVIIDKNDFLINMKKALRENSIRAFDYDGLLVDMLMYFVNKDYVGKIQKLDENMDAILDNIRKRVEQINRINKKYNGKLPFSYERVFDILVYYLRLVTNILNSSKDQKAHYCTAEISPEAVLFFFNRKLKLKDLDEEWNDNEWKLLSKDVKPFYAGQIEIYIRYALLATFIRYCEIRDN